jgi:hypothetical protein
MSKYHPDFVTVTCLNWVPVLAAREHKEIVMNLAFVGVLHHSR